MLTLLIISFCLILVSFCLGLYFGRREGYYKGKLHGVSESNNRMAQVHHSLKGKVSPPAKRRFTWQRNRYNGQTIFTVAPFFEH